MRHYYWVLAVILFILFIYPPCVYGQSLGNGHSVNINYEGNDVTSRMEPVVRENKIFVRGRALSKVMDADIDWVGSINTVEIERNYQILRVTSGIPFIQIDHQTLTVEPSMFIKDNEVYLPFEIIVQNFGFEVEFNPENNTYNFYEPENMVEKIGWEESNEKIKLSFNELPPYRVITGEDPYELRIELENTSLSEDYIDNLSGKDFYVQVNEPENEDYMQIVILSDYPLPSHRDENIIEEDENLILTLLPQLDSINWSDDRLAVNSTGKIDDYEFFYQDNPRRLVIDIPNLRMSKFDLSLRDNDYVEDVRVSQFGYNPLSVRIVAEVKDGKYLRVDNNSNEKLLTFRPVTETGIRNLSYGEDYISFESDNPIEPDIFTLDSPERLVLDLHNAVKQTNVPETIEISDKNKELDRLRTSRFNEQKIRIVADLNKLTGYEWEQTQRNGSYEHFITLKNKINNIDYNNYQDYLTLNIDLTGVLDYNVEELSNPSRLVIDIQGLNDRYYQEILPEPAGIIEDIRISRFDNENNITRIVFELEKLEKYEIISENPGQSISISVNKHRSDIGNRPIIIDPGHGGFDPGAIGPTGFEEKEPALLISRKVKEILENKYDLDNVVMTREVDRFISLKDRVRHANQIEAEIFVSIHLNSSTSNNSHGTETFISPERTGESLVLARNIQNELVDTIGLRDRGVKTDRLYVLEYTQMPATLVEVAFISNPEEEELLREEEFRMDSAEAIARGIIGYFEEEE